RLVPQPDPGALATPTGVQPSAAPAQPSGGRRPSAAVRPTTARPSSRRPVPEASVVPLPPRATPPPPDPTPRSRPDAPTAEEHFRRAWTALGGHDPATAVAELDAADASAGAIAILEDIRFWRGGGLPRPGRPGDGQRRPAGVPAP